MLAKLERSASTVHLIKVNRMSTGRGRKGGGRGEKDQAGGISFNADRHTLKATSLGTARRHPRRVRTSSAVDVIGITDAVPELCAHAGPQITACGVVGIVAGIARLIVVLGDFFAIWPIASII